jgi:hypothetical protein
MRPQTRVLTFIATLLSLPLAGFALVAAAHIAYSLVAEPWYRDTFRAYGSKLLVLYLLFAVGIAAAAALALRFARPFAPSRRLFLFAALLTGVIAAGFLEFTFWSDLGDHTAHGLVLLPFVAWALVAFSQR